MSIHFNGHGMYCTHCDFSFASWPPVFEHPTNSDHWVTVCDSSFQLKIKSCPDAGKKFEYLRLKEI